MAIRQFFNNVYVGLESELPPSLPIGSLFLAENAQKLFGYDIEGESFLINSTGGILQNLQSVHDEGGQVVTPDSLGEFNINMIDGAPSFSFFYNNTVTNRVYGITSGHTGTAIYQNATGSGNNGRSTIGVATIVNGYPYMTKSNIADSSQNSLQVRDSGNDNFTQIVLLPRPALVQNVTRYLSLFYTDGVTTIEANAQGLVDLSQLSFSGSDNLGNHTATENLNMSNFDVQNVKTLDAIAVTVSNDDYDNSWNGDNTVPTKNAIFDVIESINNPELALSSDIVIDSDALLEHVGGMNEVNSVSNVTITVQPNSSINLPVGTILTYRQLGTGNIIVSYESGVTGESVQTYRQADVISIWQKSLNNWVVLNKPHSLDSQLNNEPTGSDQIFNIVSLTQAEYDAGTPNATTLYIITDA